jgi:hypothetical protein
VKKRFKELLHRYKVESFKISHANDHVAETTKEIMGATEEALHNAYTYHFHEDPDPRRIETFNMIKNFVLEALMPPVTEKLMRRIVVLEKQHQEFVRLIGEVLEALSDDSVQSDAQAG